MEMTVINYIDLNLNQKIEAKAILRNEPGFAGLIGWMQEPNEAFGMNECFCINYPLYLFAQMGF